MPNKDESDTDSSSFSDNESIVSSIDGSTDSELQLIDDDDSFRSKSTDTDTDSDDIEFDEDVEVIGDVDLEIVETIDLLKEDVLDRTLMSDAVIRDEVSRLLSGVPVTRVSDDKQTALRRKLRTVQQLAGLLKQTKRDLDDATGTPLFAQQLIPLVRLSKKLVVGSTLPKGEKRDDDEDALHIKEYLMDDILGPYQTLLGDARASKLKNATFEKSVQELLQPVRQPTAFEQLPTTKHALWVVRDNSVLDPVNCKLYRKGKIVACERPDAIRLFEGDAYDLRGFLILPGNKAKESIPVFDIPSYVLHLKKLKVGESVKVFFHQRVIKFKKDCHTAIVVRQLPNAVQLRCNVSGHTWDHPFDETAPAFVYGDEWNSHMYHKGEFFSRPVAFANTLEEDDAVGTRTQRLIAPTLAEAILVCRSLLKRKPVAAYGLAALFEALNLPSNSETIGSVTLSSTAFTQFRELADKVRMRYLPAPVSSKHLKRRLQEIDSLRIATPRNLPSFLQFKEHTYDVQVRGQAYPHMKRVFDSDLARFIYVSSGDHTDVLLLAIMLRKLKARVENAGEEFDKDIPNVKRDKRNTNSSKRDEESIPEFSNMAAFAIALREAGPDAFKRGDKIRIQSSGIYRDVIMKKTNAHTASALDGWEVIYDDIIRQLESWSATLLEESSSDAAEAKSAVLHGMSSLKHHHRILSESIKNELSQARKSQVARNAAVKFLTKQRSMMVGARDPHSSHRGTDTQFLGDETTDQTLIRDIDDAIQVPYFAPIDQADPDVDLSNLQRRATEILLQEVPGSDIVLQLLTFSRQINLSTAQLQFIKHNLMVADAEFKAQLNRTSRIAEAQKVAYLSLYRIYFATAIVLFAVQKELPKRLVMSDLNKLSDYKTENLLTVFEATLRIMPLSNNVLASDIGKNVIQSKLAQALKDILIKHKQDQDTIEAVLKNPMITRRALVVEEYGLYKTWPTFVPNTQAMMHSNTHYTEKIIHDLNNKSARSHAENEKQNGPSDKMGRPEWERCIIQSRVLRHEGIVTLRKPSDNINPIEPAPHMINTENMARLDTAEDTPASPEIGLKAYRQIQGERMPAELQKVVESSSVSNLSKLNEAQLDKWIEYITLYDPYGPMGAHGVALLREFVGPRFIRFEVANNELEQDSTFFKQFLIQHVRAWMYRLLWRRRPSQYSVQRKRYYDVLVRQRLQKLQEPEEDEELMTAWDNLKSDSRQQIMAIIDTYLAGCDALEGSDLKDTGWTTVYTSIFMTTIQHLYQIGLCGMLNKNNPIEDILHMNVDKLRQKQDLMVPASFEHPVHVFFSNFIVRILKDLKVGHMQRFLKWEDLATAFESSREQRKQARIQFMDRGGSKKLAMGAEEMRGLMRQALKLKIMKWEDGAVIENSILSAVAKAGERRRKLEQQLELAAGMVASEQREPDVEIIDEYEEDTNVDAEDDIIQTEDPDEDARDALDGRDDFDDDYEEDAAYYD